MNGRWGTDLSFDGTGEAGNMIAERLAEFEAEIRAESEAKGRQAGRAEGRAAGRAEGRAAGRAAGLEEGIALERAHLCRMAARRFGAAAAESLAAALAGVSDPERLARAGDCIVDSRGAGEFVAGVRASVGAAARGPGPSP